MYQQIVTITESGEHIVLGTFKVDEILLRELRSEKGPSKKYLELNAPWARQQRETKPEYTAFKEYLLLPDDKWRVEDIKTIKTSKEQLQKWSQNNNWIERRLGWNIYFEHINTHAKRQKQLEDLQEFQFQLASMTSGLGAVAEELLKKLLLRVKSLHIDEINANLLPSLIRTISDVVRLSSDTQAQALAVADLLEIYSDEIDDNQQEDKVVNSPSQEINPVELWEKNIQQNNELPLL